MGLPLLHRREGAALLSETALSHGWAFEERAVGLHIGYRPYGTGRQQNTSPTSSATMPRYFFNVFDGFSALDEEGTELPDLDELVRRRFR